MIKFVEDDRLVITVASNVDVANPTAFDAIPYLRELYESDDPLKITAARVIQHAWVMRRPHIGISKNTLIEVIEKLPEKYKRRIGITGTGYTTMMNRLVASGVLEEIQKNGGYVTGKVSISSLYKVTTDVANMIGFTTEELEVSDRLAKLHLNTLLEKAAKKGLPAPAPKPTHVTQAPVVNPGAKRFVPKKDVDYQ